MKHSYRGTLLIISIFSLFPLHAGNTFSTTQRKSGTPPAEEKQDPEGKKIEFKVREASSDSSDDEKEQPTSLEESGDIKSNPSKIKKFMKMKEWPMNKDFPQLKITSTTNTQ